MVRTLDIGAPGGHADEVNSVAFSSDGKRLASGSPDGKVLVWNVAKGVPEYTLHVRRVEMLTDPHPPNANWVYSVAFFPQYNTMLVSGSLSGLKLWNFGKEPWEEVSESDVEHIDARVYSVAFSPDGRLLAAGLGNDKRIMLLDVGRWTVARTLAGHTESVNSVAFSPDGTLLASGSDDKTVKLWDVAIGQVLNTFTGHSGSVNSVAFSPDGKLLASGSEDGAVKLWLVDALTPTTPPREAATGPRIGERAPDFSLESLSGVEVSLSRLRGLVVILDFWASWCAPCHAAMPSLYAMWQEVADQGVRLVSVSLDRTASDASSYLAASGFDDTNALWGSLAQAQTVASLYHVTGIPRTVVIDREGIVRFNGHPARLDRGVLKGLLGGVR
jgi:WD40 repeat protein